MEEEEFGKEILDSLTKFEEVERETRKLVEENKKLKEKNKKIYNTWAKYFNKSIELNSEIFMDLKQELNHILEIEDKKIIDKEISDRQEREFRKIQDSLKRIEELELE